MADLIFRFGVFEYRPSSGELFREGVRVRLEPQPAKALTLLVERAGDLVSRDQMRAALWGADTHVDFDRGLAYCVGQVRAVLGDSAENPRFVQTLPRRGFRFIAPVERLQAGPRVDDRSAAQAVEPAEAAAPVGRPRAGSRWFDGVAPPRAQVGTGLAALGIAVLVGVAVWAAWRPPAPGRALLAVAVFDNETGLAEYDTMTAAMADAVVVRLTALAPDRLAVIGNSAVLRQPRAFRDPAAIARETGAQYLVFGQLQPDDRGLRLVTHLIRLDDDTHLWVTRVVRPPDGLEGMEARMVDRVADAVRLHIVEGRPDAPRFTPEDDEPGAVPPSP